MFRTLCAKKFLKVKNRVCLFEIFSLRSSTTLLLVVILGFGNSVAFLFVEVVLVILFTQGLTFLG